MKDFKLGDTPIAVVGMASLMPDAKDLYGYWDNIVEKMVSIVDVPADRWSLDDYYDADPFAPDKTYCKRGAFVPDIEFNPMEYGLPPNILEVTDVSQLLGLVVAKDVLADCNIFNEDDYDHDRIGITLGIGGGQKLSAALTARLQYPVIDKVLKSAGVPDAERASVIEKYKKAFVPWEENSFPGLLGNVIAGRIANRFNFGGMNSVVDAACASSLSAMKMAANELILGHSDLMITGGSCTDNSIFMYMSFSKTPAFTNTDFIQPFDIDSKGMMVGEGVGMIALKRLEDAERDGDRIYALLKGIGSSSDGRFKSIYAPRSEGQAKALNRAYEQAGFEPKTVGLVEAHGTGTAAGDVAEFNSLKMVFEQNNEQKQHIALGSVKSQIGHLKAAAGAAGFMKCVLALHHKVLPPTASLNTPNPKLGVEDSPFYLNAETRPWLPAEDGSPRRAAVSAFGFGGTNFHFVMEEYTPELKGAVRIKNVDNIALLAADNEAALIKLCEESLALLQEGGAETKDPAVYQSFLDANALRALDSAQARLAFLSTDADSAIEALNLAIKSLKDKKAEQAWELPQGISYRQSAIDSDGKLVALFPGQGSQYLRMGDALAQNYPEFRHGYASLDELFIKDGQPRLSDVVYPIAAFSKEDKKAQEAKLQLTQHAQPSIGAFSVGAYKLFQQAGLKADFVAGHSFGELSALWASGVISEQDFYRLAKARGAAMAAPDDPNFDAGTMMAVSGDIAALEKALEAFPEIKIANFNSNAQVVIAGAKSALESAQAPLKEQGFKLIPLPVSAAFHTPLVAHAQKPFADAIDQVEFSDPSVPVFANGTGLRHENSGAKIKEALKDHILNSVQFKKEVETIYEEGGRIFVEFGPKNVLAKLSENILSEKDDVVTLAVNPATGKSADAQFKLLAAKLAVLGVSLENLDPYAAPKRSYATQKPSPLNIKISAAAYVSDKTRQAFEDELKDDFRLSTSSVAAAPAPVAQQSSPAAVVANQAPSQSQAQVQTQIVQGAEINLDQFYALQNETLRVHEKYLENPAQYVESFQSLLSQIAEIMQERPDFELPESIERSLLMFNEQQSETIRVHETFLNNQAEASQASLNLMSEHYSLLTGGQAAPSAPAVSKSAVPVSAPAPAATQKIEAAPAVAPVSAAPAPVAAPVQSAPAFDVQALTNEMLKVVAEKTGYPTEMLELDMDMEADLGIDSIKRVEILGSIQESYPELPELDPEALSELRTLQQIVDYIKAQVPEGGAVAKAAPAAVTAPAASFDVAALTNEMLAVVADKTGYPPEMLELDMDMEADLGIDSIKRVEILGSIQEAYPELPELDPEALSELRTLQQIVDYIKEQASSSGAVAAAPAVVAPVTSALVNSAAPALDMAELKQSMLEVVAEKTGYPVDMLEMDMDMEADLGIDSIKRVEILGSIQESYPELPELDPEALSELRTLAQIIDYMREQLEAFAPSTAVASGAAAVVPAASVSSAASLNVEELTSAMLAVVADKTGYPIDMLELNMDMEADLGIDSIKRVEILGAVTEQYPELPELNPEDLAELRTLEEIVNYMKEQVSESAPVASSLAQPVAGAGTGTNTASGSELDLESLRELMMSVVAEKTGYPSDMLELDMDMEADLGIDSIKRVEILGAIQEQVPELPELDPEALSELRTLGEVVSYMKDSAGNVGDAEKTVGSESSVESQSVANTVSSGLKPARAHVLVEKLPPVDERVFDAPSDKSCLVINDGTTLTAEVAGLYQEKSWTVSLLNLPGIDLDPSVEDFKNYSLNSFEETELQNTLNKIESEQGKVAHFVYLDSAYKATGKQGLAFAEEGKHQLRHLFLLAKHLKDSLNDTNVDQRNAFVAVSHLDGNLGYSEQKTKYDALAGGVFGLAKTLAQEWPEVLCRAVDLESGLDAESAAKTIVSEAFDSKVDLAEVAINKDGRSTLVPDERFEAPAKDVEISEDSVFLVTGGAKGVTSKCIIELAKNHKSKFILLGRSPLGDEPSWAQSCQDEASLKQAAMALVKDRGDKPTPVLVQKEINPVLSLREINSVLKSIEETGSTVRYIACDVCDSEGLKSALKNAQQELGEITGLVHGAGVLADKLIENKTVEDFDSVYDTKIGGLASVLSCVKWKSLKHLVLFSSAAGFFGNPAQADYAMANDILNKVALIVASHNPDCRVLSFNWGPWDGGMVTPQLKALFESRGVELISLQGGAQLFVDYLSSSDKDAQILVGSSMEAHELPDDQKKSLKFAERYQIKRVIKPMQNAFLNDHQVGGRLLVPMVASATWHARGALNAYSEFTHLQSLSDLVVYKGLSLDPDEDLVLYQDLSKAQVQSGSMSVDSVIYSEQGGRRVNHYGATVVLTNTESEEAMAVPSLNADDKRSAANFYQDNTLFHGEGLQLLESIVKADEQEMVFEAKVATYTPEQEGQFLDGDFSNLSLDALLQASLVWAKEYRDLASLPLKVSKASYFSVIEEDSFFISLKVKEQGASKMVADLEAFSKDGKVYARFEGAEITMSKQLEQKFAS